MSGKKKLGNRPPSTHFLFWAAIVLSAVAICYVLSGILAPFIAALVLSYFLAPLVSWLSNNTYLSLPRTLASTLVILLLFTVIITFVVMIAPVLYTQIAAITHVLQEHSTDIDLVQWSNFNELIASIDPDIAKQIEDVAADFAKHVVSFLGNILKTILYSGFAMASVLALIFITPVLTFYILRDWPAVLAAISKLIPQRHAGEVRGLAQELDTALTGYLYGQTAVCLILGIFYAIGLSLVGLDYSFTLGMMTGILTLIPYVGMIFGATLAIIVATLQFASINHVLAVMTVFIIGNALEGNFIAPKLIGDRVGLHPAWVIFGLLAGGYIGGLVGMFISFPLTAVIGVFIRFALTKYQRSEFYQN